VNSEQPSPSNERLSSWPSSPWCIIYLLFPTWQCQIGTTFALSICAFCPSNSLKRFKKHNMITRVLIPITVMMSRVSFLIKCFRSLDFCKRLLIVVIIFLVFWEFWLASIFLYRELLTNSQLLHNDISIPQRYKYSSQC
jgi:lysylphosphatidylglycerol synthetase-like protein (DUF2156 family)